MTLVVDASVAVEFLLRTPIGLALQTRILGSNLLAPDLLDIEVLAVLRRAVLQGRLNPARAEEALDDLVAWPLRRIPSASLVHAAWQYRDNTTAYDALYLALAARVGAPLLTADGAFARGGTGGVVIEHVRLG